MGRRGFDEVSTPTPTYGQWTEARVTASTALGTQPDFTYSAHEISKGAATREIGDALVLLGQSVVVLSVKARDPEAGKDDTPEKARSWLDKRIRDASSQIEGVVRTLRQADPGSITLTSERGRSLPWDPSLVEEYLGVIVVNYSPPTEYVPQPEGEVPKFVILAPEWGFLVDEIFTTKGVVNYVRQRVDLPISQALGTEREVQGLLGLAEFGADVLLAGDEALQVPAGTWDRFRAEFPEAAFGWDVDDNLGFVIDAMIAQAYDLDPARSSSSEVRDHLRILELLDAIPRLTRTFVGQTVVEKATLAGEEDRPRYFLFEVPDTDAQILFLAHPGPREDREVMILQMSAAIHSFRADRSETPDQLETLGVATEPYPSEGRSHSFAYFRGSLSITEPERMERDQYLEDYFGSLEALET